MEINKVSFIGCGALGVMYASHILEKLPYAQVQFIAGDDRIERYRNTEFSANGVPRPFSFVTPDEGAAPSDLVIFTVKAYALDDAILLARNHVGENTIILSFLNGISSEEIIGRVFSPEKIIPSIVAGMDATRTGHSVNFTQMGYVGFGKLEQNSQGDIDDLIRFFDRAQLKYDLQEDIFKTIWWKFMLNSGINPVSALLGAPYGLFQSSPHAGKLMMMAMLEVYEISQKLGIGLDGRDIENAVSIVKTLSPDGKTSMCQDIEANRPTEIDIFAGAVLKLGEKHGVPVPINTFLFNAIKALESKRITGNGQ